MTNTLGSIFKEEGVAKVKRGDGDAEVYLSMRVAY